MLGSGRRSDSPISSIRTSRHVPARPRTAECACVSLCILEVFVLLALVAGAYVALVAGAYVVFVLLALVAGAYVAGAILAVASRHTKGLDCIRQHGHITTRYIHVSRCHKIHSCISFHVIVFGNMVTSPQDTFMQHTTRYIHGHITTRDIHADTQLTTREEERTRGGDKRRGAEDKRSRGAQEYRGRSFCLYKRRRDRQGSGSRVRGRERHSLRRSRRNR